MEESHTHDFVLRAGEVATNALIHAGGGAAFLYRLTDSLLFVCKDEGPGIDLRSLPEAFLGRGCSATKSLGIGLKTILAVADKVPMAMGPVGTTVAVEMKFRQP